jgi:hypothetical protein
MQFVLIYFIFCYPVRVGANRPPVGISQALLTALAARGRPFAPPSGSGSGLGLGSGPFDPHTARGAGRINHSTNSTAGGSRVGPSSSAHVEGGRALGPSTSSPAPSSAMGSSMTDLD